MLKPFGGKPKEGGAKNDDEAHLNMLARDDIYRQRLFSDTWTKCEGTFEVDTHKWTWPELICYSILLLLTNLYVFSRVSIFQAYQVNEGALGSFQRPAVAMDYDMAIYTGIEDKLLLSEVKNPADAASWITYYLPQAILPSIQEYTMPFGAIRMTNRRVKMETNPSTRMNDIALEVWAYDEGINTREHAIARENTEKYGAYRLREHELGRVNNKVRYFPRVIGMECSVGQEDEPFKEFSGFTSQECKEQCSIELSLDPNQVCRCATFILMSEGVITTEAQAQGALVKGTGLCKLYRVPETGSYTTPPVRNENLPGEAAIIGANLVPADNATSVWRPVLQKFVHESERWGWTPDAGYRPGQDKSEGYRNTAGFVTFSPLFYEGFGIEYDFKGDGICVTSELGQPHHFLITYPNAPTVSRSQAELCRVACSTLYWCSAFSFAKMDYTDTDYVADVKAPHYGPAVFYTNGSSACTLYVSEEVLSTAPPLSSMEALVPTGGKLLEKPAAGIAAAKQARRFRDVTAGYLVEGCYVRNTSEDGRAAGVNPYAPRPDESEESRKSRGFTRVGDYDYSYRGRGFCGFERPATTAPYHFFTNKTLWDLGSDICSEREGPLREYEKRRCFRMKIETCAYICSVLSVAPVLPDGTTGTVTGCLGFDYMDYHINHGGPVCAIYPIDECGIYSTKHQKFDDGVVPPVSSIEDLGLFACSTDGEDYGIAPCDPLVFGQTRTSDTCEDGLTRSDLKVDPDGYLPSDRFGDASGPDCESVIDSRTGLFLCVPTSPKDVGPFPATSDDEGLRPYYSEGCYLKQSSDSRLKYPVVTNLQEIFGGGYLSSETTALTTDFVAYHVNYQFFVWVQIEIVFRAAGGATGSIRTDVLPLKPNDYFYTTIGGRRFTLEDDATIGGVPIVGFPGLSWMDIVVGGSIIIFNVYEIAKMKSRWLHLPWSVIDTAYLLSAASTLYNAYRLKVGLRAFTDEVENAEFDSGVTIRDQLATFLQDFTTRTGVQLSYVRAGAVYMCLAWIRVVKYLADVSSDIGVIWDTIRRATTAIIFFLAIFLLMLLGFASWASAYFGVKIPGFNRLYPQSVFTCLYFTFGDVDLVDKLMREYGAWGVFFFFLFMFTFYFILVNFVNAILNASYEDAEMNFLSKQEVARSQKKEEGKCWSILKRVAGKCAGLCGGRAGRKGSGDAADGENGPTIEVGESLHMNGSSPANGGSPTNGVGPMSPTKVNMNGGLRDSAFEAEEEKEEGESPKMIALYFFFAFSYLLMMRLYTNVETSYEMTKNIRQEIKAATFEFNDVPFTFDDIATYEEVRLWIEEALPTIMYSSKDSVYSRYGARPEYPQLVLKDVSVFVGQSPVRVNVRLFDYSTVAEFGDMGKVPTSLAATASKRYSFFRRTVAPSEDDLYSRKDYSTETFNDTTDLSRIYKRPDAQESAMRRLFNESQAVPKCGVPGGEMFPTAQKCEGPVEGQELSPTQKQVQCGYQQGFMCVMPACQDEDRAPQCARKKDIAETCKKTCTEKEEKVGKPKEEIADICRKECMRAIAETVFGGDFASALRNAVNTQTASITFDFAIFNPHVSLFTYVAIEFQFPPSGVVKRRLRTDTLRLDPYSGQDRVPWGVLRLVLFYIYVALWMFFMVDEAVSFISEFLEKEPSDEDHERWRSQEASGETKDGRCTGPYVIAPDTNVLVRVIKTIVSHFTGDPYNVLDFISYTFSGQTIFAWMQYDNDPFRQLFYFEEVPEWEPEKCKNAPVGYRDVCSDADVVQRFFLLSNLFRNFVRLGSANCIIICVRMLKFLREDKRMQVIVGTLGNTIVRVIWFLLMLAIVSFAFVFMAYLSFGSQVGEFSELSLAIKKCFIMVIGNFDFEELNAVDFYMARAFFFPFMILFYFVLMNIFLAIIDMSFAENAENYEKWAAKERKRNQASQKPKRGIFFRVVKAGFVMMRGMAKKRGPEGEKHGKAGGKKVFGGQRPSVLAAQKKAVGQGGQGDGAYIHIGKMKEAVENRAKSQRGGAAAIDAAAAESWAQMPDEICDWSVGVFQDLYEDLNRWDLERKECSSSEELEEMFVRMKEQLNYRLAGLNEEISKREQTNKATVLHDLETTVKDQDVLCAHIMKLQEELLATDSLKDENEENYNRLRAAASALVLGREEGEAPEE